jgi:hypothetical protein
MKKRVASVLFLISVTILCGRLSIELKPQFSATSEEVGIYFGFDGNTVSDKYTHSENFQLISLEGSITGNRAFFKWHYTSTDGLGLGALEKDLHNYWHELTFRLMRRDWYELYAYSSYFKKELTIPDETEYMATNSKYLLGAGVRSNPQLALANMQFTDFTQGGAFGCIYLGAGSYRNEVEIPASNPSSPYSGSWEFEASEDFGAVFLMDMGFIWSPHWGYAAAKMKVGGFMSGTSQTNGSNNDGQMVNGSISFHTAAGIQLSKRINLGAAFIISDENCRNEDDEMDGSHFATTAFNLFCTINFSVFE